MNKYQKYLVTQLAVVIVVILLFKVVESKKIAAVLNSLLFLISTVFILWSERELKMRSLSSLGAALFLVFGVFPVMMVRFLNWEADFSSTQIWGQFTGAELHRFSNYPFIFMLICLFIDSYRLRLKDRNPKE